MTKININKNWIQWFIGFCDAEGNFQTFPKKRFNSTKNLHYYNIGYGFHLSLSIKDRTLLQKIHLNLNSLGHFYEYPDREEVRIAITRSEDLKWLITNIFEVFPLLTKHQRDRYSRLKFGVLTKFNRIESIQEYQEYLTKRYDAELPILSNINATNKIIFDNWMSGFINGEGAFVIHPKGYLLFYIEQVEGEVLTLIKNRLNATPNILFRPSRGKNRSDTYSFAISSKKDISSLIQFFEEKNNPFLKPLYGNKKAQFDEWKNFYYNSGKYF